MLMQLTDVEKLDVIVMLVNSLKSSGKIPPISAKQFYGIWGDDGMTTAEFVNELASSRSFHQDIIELWTKVIF